MFQGTVCADVSERKVESGGHKNGSVVVIQLASVPHPVCLSPRPPRTLKQKKFQLYNSPVFLYLRPAPTTQETSSSPPDYVLHPYTPDPQPALNATLSLYITLY